MSLPLPLDEFNQALLARVHPPNWENPTPASCYDLVVIGGGTAGLVTAIGAAELNLGLKIALIEKSLLGGDCLNWGCVPSKTLIAAARRTHQIRNAAPYGIHCPHPTINFAQVMERVRAVRAEISHHDSVERCHQAGIDVFFGTAQFRDSHHLYVEQQILTFKRAVIATGARATIPNIPGLDTVPYFTNETIFNLTELPQKLAIIGGGPIGCELGQALQRLGSQVTIFQRAAQILPHQDLDTAQLLETCLRQEGIEIKTSTQIQTVIATGSQAQMDYYRVEHPQEIQSLTVDGILVAAGRTPNIETLNLAAAGVEAQPGRGIVVNDYLQTRQPHIFAAGDVCQAWKFTHAADAGARIVIKNALFSPGGLGRSNVSQLLVPRVTYTDPEVASVGISAAQAKVKHLKVQILKIPFQEVDRAVTEGETQGFLELVLSHNSDRILGAAIVGHGAGELISYITQAMGTNQGLSRLSQTIFPYPTQAEILKKAADHYYQATLLRPGSQALLKIVRWLAR
ncbi:mercuric reductase [Synechococcus sp. PCC 6312]|uniref:mercuric reductase n=1 Tax=Synechococcus sp. (strain ATCC 27167 / PCC 6312) TaxID=195253 RepID=UPI00029F0766|nr:mercuric reductase [Synechococcus sp. PCC 6312]AFY62455.1 pyruvate/2-oxoglutarate dehydrogenase complex, dihydrolipoamide dehydrogenase component [Synechococcus sp. PCC 6312]